MPLMACTRCHHEWQGHENDRCDWCEGESYILSEKTGLESLTKDKIQEIVKDVNQKKERN